MEAIPGFRLLRPAVSGRTVLLELDHGKVNEIGRAHLDEIDALAEILEAGPYSALVTFSRRRTARGRPVFCGGADVAERASWTEDDVRFHVERQRRILRRVRHLPLFHVAVVDGLCAGWGLEFLLACDHVIAGPEASFSLPETGLGIVPGAGGTALLAGRIGLAAALLLGMTGETLDAVLAMRLGLVQETVPDIQAGLARAVSLARMVARRSPTAVAAFKAAVLDGSAALETAGLAAEEAAYEACLRHGDAALGRARFRAILEGEEPAWPERLPAPPISRRKP